MELNKANKIINIQSLKAREKRKYYDTHDFYGIRPNDPFPVSSLCILFYTNNDGLCTKFRMSFFKDLPKKK